MPASKRSVRSKSIRSKSRKRGIRLKSIKRMKRSRHVRFKKPFDFLREAIRKAVKR